MKLNPPPLRQLKVRRVGQIKRPPRNPKHIQMQLFRRTIYPRVPKFVGKK